MPETLPARTKILKYLETEKISQNDLALLINENRQYLNEVLNGKKVGKRPNLILLKIVSMFVIR